MSSLWMSFISANKGIKMAETKWFSFLKLFWLISYYQEKSEYGSALEC